METRTIELTNDDEEICTWTPCSSCNAVVMSGDAPQRATYDLDGALTDWEHFRHVYPDHDCTVWARVEGDTFRQVSDPTALIVERDVTPVLGSYRADRQS